ncbi:MAG: hypothetical protein IJ802_06935 [Kiritimatiellae bacterium]|nr:hypothetical protein [Kiritimatiellia bacterium]
MRRPFEALATMCGTGEGDVLRLIEESRAKRLVRRFGGVFDTRRLGYKSALCCADVPNGEIDAAAAKITPLAAVTHCYMRRAENIAAPALWFTLSEGNGRFDELADHVRNLLRPWNFEILFALKRYKIDVIFPESSRIADEKTEFSCDADEPSVLSAEERSIVARLCGDTIVQADYFAQFGDAENTLETVRSLHKRGILKRIALLLAHRNAGWVANGMCCWRMDGDTVAAGRALAACAEVSHAYERVLTPIFPFNLFAMVHAKTPAEAHEKFLRVQAASGLENGVMLVSRKEYKKTSLSFWR